ncbi:MAG: hypothetical protein R3C14_43060 [Caldilineaceae bacterium]
MIRRWIQSAARRKPKRLAQLLDEARSTLDFETRRTLYQEAQQLGITEGGHLIPFHVNQFTVVSNNVTGVQARAEHTWSGI